MNNAILGGAILDRARRLATHLGVPEANGRGPVSGVSLPPRRLRTGGRHFVRDVDFVRTAREEAGRLRTVAKIAADSAVLDLGCGAGRLAIGLLESGTDLGSYQGLDVRAEAIEWCQRAISAGRPRFRFSLIDARNARYNPTGTSTRVLPVDEGAIDVSYAYSVFSHMRTDDVAAYLSELSRVAVPGGRSIFTAFVENDVEDDVENPVGYGPVAWAGALHCVRFSRTHFDALVESAGFTIDSFVSGRETDGQSLYIVHAGP